MIKPLNISAISRIRTCCEVWTVITAELFWYIASSLPFELIPLSVLLSMQAYIQSAQELQSTPHNRSKRLWWTHVRTIYTDTAQCIVFRLQHTVNGWVRRPACRHIETIHAAGVACAHIAGAGQSVCCAGTDGFKGMAVVDDDKFNKPNSLILRIYCYSLL